MGGKTKTKTKRNRSSLTTEQFAHCFNDVVDGKAVFSNGQPVPVSRKGIADYCGLSYNAMIAREKSARKKGVNLRPLAAGKRGKGTDVASINASIAERDAAAEMTE